MSKIRELLTDEVRQGGMWVVAFVCVTVLVGMGKVKPESLEYLLFALIGRSSAITKGRQVAAEGKEDTK